MSIKLTIEKVVTETGDKGYKLISFEGIINTYDLKKVLQIIAYPYVNGIFIGKHGCGWNYVWNVGQIINQEEFDNFIDLLKKAGQELHELNKRKKELESQHHGTFEVYI